MDQLEERILQIDQLKNASKRLQHRVDCTLDLGAIEDGIYKGDIRRCIED